MWHQLCQRSKYTTSVDVQKTRNKKLAIHVKITCERSESARERKIAPYKKRSTTFIELPFVEFIATVLYIYSYNYIYIYIDPCVCLCVCVRARACVCVCNEILMSL